MKNYFTNLDITNSMAKSSLSLQWERIKRLATCSFGIQKNEFPKIKFSSCKQGREENICYQQGSILKSSKSFK